MIKMIANVSANGVIGKNGDLAIKYKEDFKLFKNKTLNSVVIMGRNTFESMNSKPLPKRKNVIISSTMSESDNITVCKTLEQAVVKFPNAWLIGGARIYQEGMKYAESIHLTLSPDIIEGDNLVKFPWINPNHFSVDKMNSFKSDNRLIECIYIK